MSIMAKKAVTVHQCDVTKVLSCEVIDLLALQDVNGKFMLTVIGKSTDGNWEKSFLVCPPFCPFVFAEREVPDAETPSSIA